VDARDKPGHHGDYDDDCSGVQRLQFLQHGFAHLRR
jgi:hypothetical protein